MFTSKRRRPGTEDTLESTNDITKSSQETAKGRRKSMPILYASLISIVYIRNNS